MKNVVVKIVLILVLVTSCNNQKNKNQIEEVQMKTQKNKQSPHTGISFDWQKDMVLDNGKKWQANSETTEGIHAMIDLVNNHDMATVESFNQLGEDLNIIKNYIIKSCTMKGESHNNLHVFLLPLMQKIDELSEVSNDREGATLQMDITRHLELYTTYFKTNEH